MFRVNKNLFGLIAALIVIAAMSSGCSSYRDAIVIIDYFPVDKAASYELVGVFDDIYQQQKMNIAVKLERTGKQVVEGKEVYIQRSKYRDDSGNQLLDVVVYFDYDEEGKVLELGRQEDNVLSWHDAPNIYLLGMKPGETAASDANNVKIKTVGYVDVEANNSVYKDCLLVEKTFYDGSEILRKEQLYLKKDFGLVKYTEEAFTAPYKLEIVLIER